MRSKGKGGFIKKLMARDDSVGLEIRTPISLVIIREAKVNTQSRLRRKLVRGGRREVGVTMTTEDTKSIIQGHSTEEGMVWSRGP